MEAGRRVINFSNGTLTQVASVCKLAGGTLASAESGLSDVDEVDEVIASPSSSVSWDGNLPGIR